MPNKKTTAIIFILFLSLSLTGCVSYFQEVEEVQTENTLERIIANCDYQQGIVNMQIIPSCYLRGMLSDLQYTKDDALKYCLDNWNNCEEGIDYAWTSLGGDYSGHCIYQVFKDKEQSEQNKYMKPCILDKLITNNKLPEDEAVEYCEENVPWGEGTCEEKVKEIDNYRKLFITKNDTRDIVPVPADPAPKRDIAPIPADPAPIDEAYCEIDHDCTIDSSGCPLTCLNHDSAVTTELLCHQVPTCICVNNKCTSK